MTLPILIGCEESQTVCTLFRLAGFEAYSCDILPTRGNPKWHFQDDVKKVIPTRRWGLIILHPDCTCMAISGNRWYGKGTPGYNDRLKAIDWTVHLWNLSTLFADKVALENPISVVFNHLPNVHYVQPYEHGHGETKKTGFALHNLPPLAPTNLVEGREPRVHRMAPGPNRKRDRSKTYAGIASAMVLQWGPLL